MASRIYDLLIVGMGLAGINVSYSAKENNLSCYHFHQALSGESTKVAAGLINPITGRRFVKSWMIEEVMPFAEARYKAMELKLGGRYISRLNIIRRLLSYADENTWLAKSADTYLKKFLLEKVEDNRAFAQNVIVPEIVGELQDCFRIQLIDLQKDYLNYLKEEASISMENFDHDALKIMDNHIQYKEIKAKRIVFCEGWKHLDNPFFNTVPLAPAKGELLIIHAPNLQLGKAYKKDIFVTPIGDDLYWVGATYEWQNYNPEVTNKMKTKLLNSLDEMIRVPYIVKHHLSGIRPASKDRKPIMGAHPKHNKLFLFNGMGTKGSSLAPYFSNIFVQSLLDKVSIPSEVSIERYYEMYEKPLVL